MKRQRDQQGQVAMALEILLAIAVIVAIVIGGYQLGWWLNKDSRDRQERIDRRSYQVQQTYRDQISKDLRDIANLDTQIEGAEAGMQDSLRAQRIAVINLTCRHADRITDWGGAEDDKQEIDSLC